MYMTSPQNIKVLVTGHLGFIGHNMIKCLHEQTNWEIDGWDWNPSKFPQVELYDWVIHLGAIADMSCTDVDAILKQNLEFSQWVFKECNLHHVNLQYASSSSVYGNTNDFREDAPCRPQTPYAWSKFLFDRWVSQQTHQIIVQGFRYFNVYGEHMELRGHRANAIHKWREQARTEDKITVWKTAENISRDWTWVGDVCRLHIDFIKGVTASGVWNVGPSDPYNFMEIAKAIDTPIELVLVPELEKLRMRDTTCADLTKLTATVGLRKWQNVFEWIQLTKP
jgi:ADP-L-glycero-D-manno-heptose 6-epimerase